MPKRKVYTAAGLLATLFVACHVKTGNRITANEAIGRYESSYGQPKEYLEIHSDGSCEHSYTRNGERRKTTGHWSIPDYFDENRIDLSCLVLPEAISPLEFITYIEYPRKSLNGGALCIDVGRDEGQYFQKIGER